jgi:hypothetical protein
MAYTVFVPLLSASTYSGLMFDLVDAATIWNSAPLDSRCRTDQRDKSMERAAAGEVPPGYWVDKRPT